MTADRSLQRYREKRDPERTPEPFGTGQGAIGSGATVGRFVIQQHAARRMHWDLRLEIDGVLVSWAVPRGPSVDANEKRLAVQTEDHPLEYGDFEGLIPPGNYGAGATILWDRGSYRAVDDVPAAQGLVRGKFDVEFHGYKIRGRWALVRTKGGAGKDWLLIKKHDGQSTTPEPVSAQPKSVVSGLTVEELAQGVRRTGDLAGHAQAAGATRRTLAVDGLAPMLAETAERAFSKSGWCFELKFDGVRVLAARDADGRVSLRYRTGRDASATFPEITRVLGYLPCDEFVIDGEVCALDERGVTSFELLQKRLGLNDFAAIARAEIEVPVRLMCFDLLTVAGYDLRSLALSARKDLLTRLLPPEGLLRYSEHFEGDGEALYQAAGELGLEGIVAKRLASTYQSGRRSRDWLKIKVLRTADFAVVGYVRGKGVRKDLGSLMLAWQQDGELVYAGNVGSGLDPAAIGDLLPRLEAATRPRPAFHGTPPGPARGNVFVDPMLVAEVRYSEVTEKGLLRHPVFVRLRPDKTVAECDAPRTRRAMESVAVNAAAAAAPAASGAPTLRVSNLDKMFWPQDGYTKGDLLAYYEAIWPAIAPYLHERPVVLTRYPDGIDGKNFFQKNAPGFTPDWVQTCRIEDNDYFICNDLPTLLYVINSACIPLHVWSARRGSLQRPDWTILDLDPKGAPFRHVVQLANHLHALLSELGIPHFVKTSGQDGLHILIPLGAALTHVEARMFAELLARVAVAEQAEIATVARALGARGGKVYVDYLQNGFGKTIVAPFSVRPRAGAPVSMPLAWHEVNARLDPARFTMRTAPPRLQRRTDPLRRLLDSKADVHGALQALSRRLAP